MIEHGKIGRYTYYRCRCDDCRRASRNQKRKERAALSAEEKRRARIRARALEDINDAWKERE